VIIPRIKSDFFELIEGVAYGDLSKRILEIDERFVTTVMLVSGGYPGNYEKGKTVVGLDLVSESVIFHSGTKKDGGQIVTAGGRVLAISSWGSSMKQALSISYKNASVLKFDGSYYRTDIGFDL
jgi:phosphoribosylamine--glycine ligase